MATALAAVAVSCGGGAAAERAPVAPPPGGRGAAAVGHAAPHGHAGHRFERADDWARVFDDPARDAWQKPEQVIDLLALFRTDRVVDLGAATGYFATRVARRLPEGVVYAADVEPDMVRYLRERAARERLPNVRPVLATPDDVPLERPVDVALVVDTYHHLSDRVGYFRRFAARLRPGGRVVVIDFTKDAPEGPPPEQRLAPAQVEAEMRDAGYVLDVRHDVLPRQYFLVFRRNA
jgi:SAM-dependent methyltransferase